MDDLPVRGHFRYLLAWSLDERSGTHFQSARPFRPLGSDLSAQSDDVIHLRYVSGLNTYFRRFSHRSKALEEEDKVTSKRPDTTSGCRYDGKPLHTFDFSASYATGGFAGMNETRMSWLFEKFSELTVEEVIVKQTSGTQ